MKRILLVKITSMGDLIQMLPALTDAQAAIPGIQLDWLVEESFQEVPRLHPTIDQVITLPYRRWKKNKKQAILSGEIRAFWRQLRERRYDMVIDAQSNIKSAVVSMLAKGVKYGLDSKSVREYGAQIAYHKKISISRQQNHTERMRELLATFLDYEKPTTPANYGIDPQSLPQLDFDLPQTFIFITPIASCDNKLWPEPFWQVIIQELRKAHYEIVMPWWSQAEKERVTRLKNGDAGIHLLPPLNLSQKASVLSKASFAISLDTGLAHMAAALNIPNVCLYGPSNPEHCGTIGYKQIHLRANAPSCAPCFSTKCTYPNQTTHFPACMSTISPEAVLAAFHRLLA